jgi:hypothetical protein
MDDATGYTDAEPQARRREQSEADDGAGVTNRGAM